jgi:hypothetical protein
MLGLSCFIGVAVPSVFQVTPVFENMFRGRPDAVGDYGASRELGPVLRAVAGKDANPACASVDGELHIVGVISDDEGTAQVDPEFRSESESTYRANAILSLLSSVVSVESAAAV